MVRKRSQSVNCMTKRVVGEVKKTRGHPEHEMQSRTGDGPYRPLSALIDADVYLVHFVPNTLGHGAELWQVSLIEFV